MEACGPAAHQYGGEASLLSECAQLPLTGAEPVAFLVAGIALLVVGIALRRLKQPT